MEGGERLDRKEKKLLGLTKALSERATRDRRQKRGGARQAHAQAGAGAALRHSAVQGKTAQGGTTAETELLVGDVQRTLQMSWYCLRPWGGGGGRCMWGGMEADTDCWYFGT